MKKALLSVSDKSGLDKFAKELVDSGYDILSTGGTLKYLKEHGIECTAVEDYTNFPEILEGRVKTLHPKIHGGILAKRDSSLHTSQLEENDIAYIDLICVNLYPFEETIKKLDSSHEDKIENIDIGGPSLLRAAAKNYKYITVVTDVEDYDLIIEELKSEGNTSEKTREYLAAKVFNKTANYDLMIANYFNEKILYMPDTLNLKYKLKDELRYGENPHQKAFHYISDDDEAYRLQDAKQLNGKQMSYNNIQDASAALDILNEFDETVCVAVKHMNPCGVAVGETVLEAFKKAYEADPISIFGGIIAINGKIDLSTAEELNKLFLEIILAYDYEDEALELLKKKKNLRIFTIPRKKDLNAKQIKSVRGGILVQDYNNKLFESLENVTKKTPSESEISDMEFGFKIVKHVKSNAIVLVKNKQTIGIGAGQMNRVGACKIALEQAGEKAKDSVLCSDAFFPMSDSVELAAEYGVSAIIQPGGSIRDNDSIEACDENNISMTFTKMRHFKH